MRERVKTKSAAISFFATTCYTLFLSYNYRRFVIFLPKCFQSSATDFPYFCLYVFSCLLQIYCIRERIKFTITTIDISLTLPNIVFKDLSAMKISLAKDALTKYGLMDNFFVP